MRRRLLSLQQPPATGIASYIAEILLQDVSASDDRDMQQVADQMRAPRLQLNDEQEFRGVAARCVAHFKNEVENGGIWRSLWLNSKPADEKQVQRLFRLAVSGWCRKLDVDLSPESNGGSGPVDFKFSRGWRQRTLVEIKLASNTKFWAGLEKQLPQYMTSEGIEDGHFVAVCFTDAELSRVSCLPDVAASVAKRVGYNIEQTFIDARSGKKSASKL